jgi:hypothetical protein
VTLHALHEGLDEFHDGWIGCWCTKRFARLRKLARFVRRAEQAVVTDALEALGQHMQQKALDEGEPVP